MSEVNQIRFHSPDIFAGQTGVIDHDGCVIKGVSVITGNLIAEGHDLHVDDTTLKQLQECAKAKGKIPVTLDHGSGVKDLNGYLTSFRLDGNKLRADWHLLKSHDETVKMMERASVMPECFGLSVAFKGPPKGVPIGGGKMAARCEKLLSVDAVTRPAANAGLFSALEVDSSKKDMADVNPNPQQAQAQPEPTLADVVKAVQEIGERLTQHEEFLNTQFPQQENQEPTLEELNQLDDEALASIGLTRADVEAAIAEVEAEEAQQAEGQQIPEGQQQSNGQTPQGAEAVGAVAAPAGSVGSELSVLKQQVIQLQAHNKKIELKAKKDAEDIELAEIEKKALTLAHQRDEAIQLAEKYQAENQALRLAVRTGTRPVKAGIDTGIRLFSADDDGQLHQFQVRVKQLVDSGKQEGEAIRFAQKENPGLHADWVKSQGKRSAA